MKKRICSLIIMFCLALGCFTAFTGCDLLHENPKRYYNEVVAYVGDETVTRTEVLNMFNYYYYQQGYYYYYEAEEVFDMAYEALIKNKIVLNEAKKVVELTVAQKNDVWEQVFDHINSEEIDVYEDEIRSIYGVEPRETSDETAEDLPVFEKYKLETAGYEEPQEEETELKNTFEAPKKEDNLYRYLAYQKYLAELVKTAEGNGEKVESKEAVFQNELDRLYKYYEESKYIERYWVYQEKQINVSDQAILDKYNELVNTQLQQFAIAGQYEETISSTSNTSLILVHDGKYFTVQHILLSFTEDASETLAAHDGYVASPDAETKVDQFYVDAFLELRDQYAHDSSKLQLDYINPNTGETNKNDDGEEVEKTLTDVQNEIDEILDEYRTAYAAASTDAEREEAGRVLANAFYEMKFSYSKDSKVTDLTSLLNKVGYALNKDSSTKTNGFYPEFEDLAYELYATYLEKDPSIGEYDIKSCVSVSGLHFMMINCVYDAGPICDGTIAGMKETNVSLVTDQTVYDYVYELVLAELEKDFTSSITSSLYSKYTNEGLLEKVYETYEEVQ